MKSWQALFVVVAFSLVAYGLGFSHGMQHYTMDVTNHENPCEPNDARSIE